MTVEAIPDLTRRRRLWLSLDAARMTAGDMGAELGVSRATITRWLASDDAPIKTGFLKQWALRCGVPYEWLVTGRVSGNTPPGVDTQPTVTYSAAAA